MMKHGRFFSFVEDPWATDSSKDFVRVIAG